LQTFDTSEIVSREAARKMIPSGTGLGVGYLEQAAKTPQAALVKSHGGER
jgi:hypothetical protein